MSDALDAARAMLARLGTAIDPEASAEDVAAALVARADATGDRSERKEIRRVLYRLEQAGIVVPPRSVGTPAPLLGPAIDAWVSGVDGRGDRLVWLVREQPGGGVLLVAADLNEPMGLRDLRVFEVTRKQLRAMRQRFQAEAGLTFVAADWRAIDALVLEAQDRLATPDRRLDYRRVRPRLTTLAPAPPAELVSARVSAPDAAERGELVAGSASLLSEPELRTWWPDPDAMAPIVAEIRAIRESPIVLPPVQQEERLRAVLGRAAGTLYAAEPLARKLAATAFVLAETGRADAARRALAVAAALDTGTSPADVPLVQALTQRGVGTQLAAIEEERREDRAGALVLTPAELATRKAPSRPPRARE
jgi:hypothetical protein